MKVYISGPITGNENYVYEFKQREKELFESGYKPVSPVTSGRLLKKKLGREPSWEEYIEDALKVLKDCEGINFLPGWEKSRGAKIEHDFAVENNIVIVQICHVKSSW